MKLGNLLALSLVWVVSGCSADSTTTGGKKNAFGNPDDSSAGTGSGGSNFGNGANAGSVAIGTAGTGAIDLGDNCTATGAEAKVERQPADIVWVIDNSCSMANEAAAVQTNMNKFAQTLFDKGIDVHLVLISAGSAGGMPMVCPDGDFVCLLNQIASGLTFGVCIDAPFGSGMCPNDSLPPNFLHVAQNVSSWDGLVQIVNNYPMYKDMIRKDSKKHFVIVSDDNSTQMSAAEFTQSVDALDPATLSDWDFHGIFAQTMCMEASAVGAVFTELVTQTGGVFGDLCLQQFDPVFEKLAEDVAGKAQIACDWAIPPPPAGQSLDPTKVNVRFTQPDGTVVDLLKIPAGEECADREGWQYDDDANPTKVVSCEASCTRFRKDGGKVDVLFGCATAVLE